jgi:Spy/CpxP family protein refolding chaperone
MIGKTGLVVSMVALVSALAFGQMAQGHAPREDRPGMHREMMQKLNLTDQQQVQMRKLHADLEKKNIQTSAKIRLARIDMRELMLADKPDRAALEKKLREITDLQHQMKLDRLEHMLAVNGLLTPEQQKSWRDGMNRPRQQRERRMRIFRNGGPMGALEGEDQEVTVESEIEVE